MRHSKLTAKFYSSNVLRTNQSLRRYTSLLGAFCCSKAGTVIQAQTRIYPGLAHPENDPFSLQTSSLFSNKPLEFRVLCILSVSGFSQ